MMADILDAYARASDLVRPLMADIPDGHVAVGGMDGWTAVIPDPDALDAEMRRVDLTRCKD